MRDKLRLTQIDLIKGLAIIGVIAQHSISGDFFSATFSALHIWQAVPIFFIVMGINASGSLARMGYPGTGRMPWKSYLINRFDRIVVPYIMILVLDIIIGLVRSSLSLGPTVLIGQLPFGLPGNYFASALLQFILVFPLMYWLYRRYPRMTLLMSFVMSFTFEAAAPHMRLFTEISSFLYRAAILRYVAAIALGLWIADNPDFFSRKNRFIVIGAIGSLAFLVATSVLSYKLPLFFPSSNTPYMPAFFYPAALVLAGLKYLPKAGFDLLAHLGRISYHIFLAQMFFIGLVPIRDLGLGELGATVFNGVVTVAVAFVLMTLEKLIKKPVKSLFSSKRMVTAPAENG